MDACLLINKPENMTSFDVVAKLRKITKEKKIGHTGTLDPNATGLLIVLLGKYTKYLPYCACDYKRYITTFKFGFTTDTKDIWGNVIETKEITPITKSEFEKVLKTFLGKQKQIPPMYSAIKVNGKKLYELARENKTVEVKPRDIEIFDIELLDFSDTITISCSVSSGTYIRTLCEDIAKACNNLGVMTSLQRVSIQNLTLDDACEIDDALNHLNDIRILDVLNSSMPQIEVDEAQVLDIKNGKRITLKCNDPLVILLNNGQVLAAYEHVAKGIYKCKRGLF